MHRKNIISYPHMGSYAVVFHQLMRHVFPDAEILTPPPITKKTLELGGKYSPDFVCAPFKYNLGNFIEALESGANVLVQTGMGCRYGYYGELQEQILRDLGYDFVFLCFSRHRIKPRIVLSLLREAGCTLPIRRIVHALLLAICSIRLIDRYEYWMRENVGFEAVSGSCHKAWNVLLKNVGAADSLLQLQTANMACRAAMGQIELKRPENPLRVGLVGELYTLMEPHTTFHLEKQLAREGIVVSRIMSIWFLLFTKNDRRALRQCGGYLKHMVGANGLDSVAQSFSYARRGYDGILHLKSFGCIPELNATPALQNLAHREKIPVLDLSFDLQSSETGVQTRIEAFADMLRMRRHSPETKAEAEAEGA